MIPPIGRCARAVFLVLVSAVSVAACSGSSSTPTLDAPSSTTKPTNTAGDTTTTYRGAPPPTQGLTATVAGQWACAYLTALAPDTGTGAGPNVFHQAIFDSTLVEKYAAIAYARGGSKYSALESDAKLLATYTDSREINWTDPESYWDGGPPNKVSNDCRTLVNSSAHVVP